MSTLDDETTDAAEVSLHLALRRFLEQYKHDEAIQSATSSLAPRLPLRIRQDQEGETESRLEASFETDCDAAPGEILRSSTSDAQLTPIETASTHHTPGESLACAGSESPSLVTTPERSGCTDPHRIEPVEHGADVVPSKTLSPPAHKYEQGELYRGADECFEGEADRALFRPEALDATKNVPK